MELKEIREAKEVKEVIERIWATGKTELGYIVNLTHKEQVAFFLALKALSVAEGLPSVTEIKTILDENIHKGGNTKLKIAQIISKRVRGEHK